MRKLLILLFISAIAYAQPSNPPIVLVVTAPSGACASGLPDQQVISTGVLYSCQAGIWGIIPSSGSSGVASINGSAGAFTFSGSGVSCATTTCTFTGGISGSGTAGTIPLFTSSTALGNSYLSQSGNNVMMAACGGTNCSLDFGTNYGLLAAILYDGGAGMRYGWGLTNATMNFVVPSLANSGGHFNFTDGGDLGAGSAVLALTRANAIFSGEVDAPSGVYSSTLTVAGNNVCQSTGTNCPAATPSFSAITGGTNTTAAMVVGTGASLSVPTNPNSGDSSTQAASNQFVGNAINFSQSRFALNITGGTYSFDSQGSGAQVVIFVTGSAVSSIITTANPGSGYAVGDLLFIPPGGAVGGNGDAVIRVTSVSGTGFAGGQVLYGGTGYTATGLGSTTSAASGRPFTFIWQGAITSNVQIIMKFGTYLTTSNQWIMANNTTGAFTVNVCEGNASDVCSGGLTVNVAQGTNNSRQVILETDGELNIFLAAVQNFMDLTGTSDVPLLNADNTWSGTSVASTPVFNLTTAPFAGSATNSYPYLFWNTGTTPTNFSTFGTYWGVNCASGTPTVFQAWLNGASNASLTCGGTLTVGGIMANTIATQANCSNSASPAVCAAAAAGSVVVAATATTVTVNTTRVTASSLIFLTFDSSLGTKNGVTCNTTFSQPFVTGRVAGTSFTATVSVAPVTNPLCFSYLIVN